MSAQIIPFPSRHVHRRIGPEDRLSALRWSIEPRAIGRVRIRVCEQNDPELGDFVLLYEGEGASWASWGVSREGRWYRAWRADGPECLGRYATMRAALDAVLDAGDAASARMPAG